MIKTLQGFFRKPFFSNPRTLLFLWLLFCIYAGISKAGNNFLIFRGVFYHLTDQFSLYAEYPSEYFDVNHYGPFFSLVIAPFALLPVFWGELLWSIVMTLFLFWAIWKLPLGQQKRVYIYWFCAHEMLTAAFMNQFNIVITAIIILAFIFVEEENDIWATLLIVIGAFVKLYGIVGIAFFFFSKHKGKFILSFLGWSVLCFVLPMLISSPDYVVGQYVEWFNVLVYKNSENLHSLYQNISMMGMIHKISDCWFSDLYIIIPGMVVFALPYLRIKQYRNMPFRLALLSSVLMFTVLFSTGSESSTYIIAFAGVAIWYWSAPWKRSKWDIALMIFAFILTSMSPSDLFPEYIRVNFVRPYALKALPCAIIWIKVVYEMLTRDYATKRV